MSKSGGLEKKSQKQGEWHCEMHIGMFEKVDAELRVYVRY